METSREHASQSLGILRFRAAHGSLSSGTPASRVALDAGYSDQAHMVREFRKIAGVTPSKMS